MGTTVDTGTKAIRERIKVRPKILFAECRSNPANPNIGLRERSCIVDTVACHRYHMAFGLQSLHDFALLVG
jgi:hypothetical protein